MPSDEFVDCEWLSVTGLLPLTGRYVAPEVYKNEEYDTKVDVFSFALILQEVKMAYF